MGDQRYITCIFRWNRGCSSNKVGDKSNLIRKGRLPASVVKERECHNLIYKNCQESHNNDSLYKSLARGTHFLFDEMKNIMESVDFRTKAWKFSWPGDIPCTSWFPIISDILFAEIEDG